MGIIISPSLLACDFLNIETELNYFKDFKDVWMHLDIMDGHFVPNLTFGIPIIKMISRKTKLPLDAHLMVTNPEFHMEQMKEFGLHNLTFHFEAVENCLELVKKAKKYYPNVGISIKPKTDPSALPIELLEEIDLLLVMSVEPGFGGQSFMECTYDKLDKIKALMNTHHLHFSIQVDGGVSDVNAKKLVEHGADNLVAGSYVFKEGPSKYFDKIQSLRK